MSNIDMRFAKRGTFEIATLVRKKLRVSTSMKYLITSIIAALKMTFYYTSRSQMTTLNPKGKDCSSILEGMLPA